VSTNLPGVSWVNRNGETGLTVPPRDAQALAAAVNKLLDDPLLREKLADGARRRAAELTHDQMCADYRALYAECVSDVA
jgi:glycogen synthase